ncbi:MAG: cation:proton antiporter [Candidatus Sericytochromatia bacterium]|nr:cation:proton antiporter [Candidatus Tanganyikabacteria bacterium]
MHQSLPLLVNISVALMAALLGGLVARRLRMPAMVGYLMAGVAIGPFTPGFVGDVEMIRQLAEMGVIFLMFGVGLHFSLRDLWNVRDAAVPGALGQIVIATIAGVGLSQVWGWSVASGLVLGLAVSVASTVVLLRGLMDEGLLGTEHGQVAVGWLVLEDLVTILILVLLPLLFGTGAGGGILSVGWALLKAAAFVALMLYVAARFAPWLLAHLARSRSRELFILAVVAIALGTAVGSAELFGVSLALGAFLGGVILGQSPVGHQVGADVLPFRETFAVLFFVSIGMLVNVQYLLGHIGPVLALTALIVAGKFVFTLALGLWLPRPARTTLVVAAGLSQIGEFSFLVGQAGVQIGVLTWEQYSLILAGSLLSIMVNPAMFRLIDPVEVGLRRLPWLWRMLDRHGFPPPRSVEPLGDHAVVVGYGRVGRHVSTVLSHLGVRHLVVEFDAEKVDNLRRNGIEFLYGDASNSEVLAHVGLERARALVVTVGEEAVAERIVSAAIDRSPELPIIARAATSAGMERLAKAGAQDVVIPEFEGSIEVLRHTLLALGYPKQQAEEYADALRRMVPPLQR